MIVQIVTQDDEAYVKLRYDEAVIAVIKKMPNREWDKPNKVWWIDASDARTLATLLHRMGHQVFLDGQEFKPLQVGNVNGHGDAFESLFHLLPDVLRLPIYRGMSKVLHPDMGGDTRLMQMLNDAYEPYKSIGGS